MPGKQMGMSETCNPEPLIGALPNLGYYAASNSSEATITKRRGYASTISYLTPPAENAGLFRGLKELGELVGSHQQLREGGRGVQNFNTIVETARQCNLDKDVDLPGGDASTLEREEDGLCSLPGLLTESMGRTIDEVYKGNDEGVLADVELNRTITDRSQRPGQHAEQLRLVLRSAGTIRLQTPLSLVAFLLRCWNHSDRFNRTRQTVHLPALLF